MAVLKDEAFQKHSEFTCVGKPEKVRYGLKEQSFSYTDRDGNHYEKLTVSLAGKYQIENAALAVEAVGRLKAAGFPVTEKQLRKGLLTAAWPCRFEVAGSRPLFILDGAHNEDAAKKLADSIRFYFTNKRIIYIMGMLRDKEYEKVIAETYVYADQIITITPPENPRALDALSLAQTAGEFHPAVTAAGSLEEAVEMAYLLADKEDVIISFGSLSYLGRLKEILADKNKKKAAGKGTHKSGCK
jgi:dihydrofolate synthase/folylpolyglutamate synthase